MSNHDTPNSPPTSPLQPVRLSLDDTIQFRCHRDIACFNECCHCIEIQLTPYDILRLKQRLGLTSQEFLAQYTLPFEMDAQGMPGVRIRTLDDKPICPFVTAEGCSVYEDRPTVCRYYALGLMSMRHQEQLSDENYYFLIKEDHCQGHQEDRILSIRDYRLEQGLEIYDEMNREWRQIILKKRSAGPAVGKPTPRSYQFFFLGSYNLDSFRNFVFSPGFSEVYEIDPDTLEVLKQDDLTLLKYSFKLLKQVLFGEMHIVTRDDALQKRVQRRRELENVDETDPNKDYNGPIVV